MSRANMPHRLGFCDARDDAPSEFQNFRALGNVSRDAPPPPPLSIGVGDFYEMNLASTGCGLGRLR